MSSKYPFMIHDTEGKTETRSGQKPKYKILYSLLIVLIFVGLAPLATVTWKLVDINKEALKTFQQQSQPTLASSIASRIDSILDENRAKIRFIADSLASNIAEKGSTRFIDSLVRMPAPEGRSMCA